MTPGALPDRTTVVVIGAGQAGLATSACLTDRAIDHLVVERSVIGHSWKHERWDSLRTLTPNWMTRLPGLDPSIVAGGRADHDDDAFDRAADVARVLDDYAAAINVPVLTGVDVDSVRRRDDGGFVVTTNVGTVMASAVVVASGACVRPAVPSFAAEIPERVHQMTPTDYRSPHATPAGAVLVVGGSASGTQLADELTRAGRTVTLATAAHTRMVREYRGHDIFWWMREMNELGRAADPAAVDRPPPSMQLIGTPERRTLDLGTLRQLGVHIAGSMQGVVDGIARFDDDLGDTTTDADRRLVEHLARIDGWIAQTGRDADFPPPAAIEPIVVTDPVTSLDLAEIDVIIWATGFRFHFPFADPAWLNDRGAIEHRGGITPIDGLAVVGMPYNRTRSSNFILGAGPDADFVVSRLAHRLRG